MGPLFGALLNHSIWAKGTPIPGYDPGTWRRDAYGNNMKYSDFGNRASQFGWERDHVVALALGGTDTVDNMRPCIGAPMPVWAGCSATCRTTVGGAAVSTIC